MTLALEVELKTIAFPAISTVVYRFPMPCATMIAVKAVAGILRSNASFEQVIVCTFWAKGISAYAPALGAYR